jgi:hypothetical protein
MKLIDRVIRKGARSQMMLPLKDYIGKKLRETYYNAEVLHRIEAKTEPLNMQVTESAPERVNLLLPEINFRSFYGGYMAKFHLARKLVAEGYAVRFVIVDPCVQAPEAWRDAVAHYAGLERIFEDVEVSYQGDRAQILQVSGNDRFIATTWWTAYLANDAARRTQGPPFVYLIQEYEPFTFPMGSYYAMAHHSYSFPHHALFSSSLLQEYFQIQNIGVYAGNGNERGANHFENAIVGFTSRELSAAMERREQPGTKKKLLFYARPEAHATRNMFEVAFLALSKAIERNVFGADWEFHGIGSGHGNIALPNGHSLKMLGKFNLDDYRSALLEYDLGLSLMYTPHPSLLPLDMAAAGMLVVSNSCMNKTGEKLLQLSGNLFGAAPHIDGVLEGLKEAVARVDDVDGRLAGAEVHWAKDWDRSFNNQVLQDLKAWLT